MLISIITPTHMARWLRDCYQSLCEQIHQDFEWIIVRNGDPPPEIPQVILSDPRTRVVDCATRSIGALKRYGCDQARGEILVELDHDDLLLPVALESVAQACVEGGAGFVYSDYAPFREDGSAVVFDERFGWEHYDVRVGTMSLKAVRSFDLTPASLVLIDANPNHVRAWRTDVYKQVGGHNPQFDGGDDHDLVCRTYLAGVPIRHIPTCLYAYRMHNSNAIYGKSQQIRDQHRDNVVRYIYPLIDQWCDRSELHKIDFSPFGGRDGYQKLIIPKGSPEPQWNMGKQWTLHKHGHKVGAIFAHDVLQRFAGPDVPHYMNEFYDMLVPGGYLLLSFPSTDGRGAFQDPSHVSYHNANSIWYYTQKKFASLVPEIRCRFQVLRCWTGFPNSTFQVHNIPYVFADLCAIKEQRQPGHKEI